MSSAGAAHLLSGSVLLRPTSLMVSMVEMTWCETGRRHAGHAFSAFDLSSHTLLSVHPTETGQLHRQHGSEEVAFADVEEESTMMTKMDTLDVLHSYACLLTTSRCLLSTTDDNGGHDHQVYSWQDYTGPHRTCGCGFWSSQAIWRPPTPSTMSTAKEAVIVLSILSLSSLILPYFACTKLDMMPLLLAINEH